MNSKNAMNNLYAMNGGGLGFYGRCELSRKIRIIRIIKKKAFCFILHQEKRLFFCLFLDWNNQEKN